MPSDVGLRCVTETTRPVLDLFCTMRLTLTGFTGCAAMLVVLKVAIFGSGPAGNGETGQDCADSLMPFSVAGTFGSLSVADADCGAPFDNGPADNGETG